MDIIHQEVICQGVENYSAECQTSFSGNVASRGTWETLE